MRLKATASGLVAAAILSVASSWAEAASPPSRLIADATGAGGSALCLAVAQDAPLADGHYPVAAEPCDALGAPSRALWTATDARELRVSVNGKSLCATARRDAAFAPLVEPYLRAFRARAPGSAFAYLGDQTAPGAEGLAQPPLVVGPCGAPEGQDGFAYDAPSGTISTAGGQRSARLCLTLNRGDPPTPVRAAFCEDAPSGAGQNVLGFDRALLPPEQRWRLETPASALPAYAPQNPRDYASGRGGLPITGPMGRCLTVGANGVFTADCDGRAEQDWKFADNQLRLESKGQCLDAPGSGSPALAPCSTSRTQLWAYTVRDRLASRAWADSDLYGQLRQLDDPQRCLVVVEDPFADPARAENPIGLGACADMPTRRMSWFLPTRVETIRVALIRFGRGPDHAPMRGASDAQIEAAFAEAVARLSADYARVGLRFVFDAAHDYRAVEDPAEADDAAALARLAGDEFYGKLVVALTEHSVSPGPLGLAADYEPGRIADPVTGEHADYAAWRTKHDAGRNRAGLPAFANFVDVPGVLSLDLAAQWRLSQAVGRYFGLRPTASSGRPADAPPDVGAVQPWLDRGASPCGNLETTTVASKPVTPDRTNGQGVFGCQLGRGLPALTPMQEARIAWSVHYQLDRMPLVACAAPVAYFADRLVCETSAALALCRETAAWLARNAGGEALQCASGAPVSREAANALKWAGLHYILTSTPQGQAVINALAADAAKPGPVDDGRIAAVSAALLAGANPPLARALLDRIDAIRDFGARNHPQMRDRAYTEKPEKPLTPDDLAALDHAAAAVLTAEFAANLPPLTK